MNISFSTYTKRAILGGVISTVFILISYILIGKLSGHEAKILIKDSIGGLNALSNTIVLACASILALLLTVLGLSRNSNSSLNKDHYRNLLQIAKLDTLVLIATLVSFVIFNLPITKSENVPSNWYNVIYYITISVSSIVSGAFVIVVIMLYNTVNSMIKIIGLNLDDHPLTEKERDE